MGTSSAQTGDRIGVLVQNWGAESFFLNYNYLLNMFVMSTACYQALGPQKNKSDQMFLSECLWISGIDQ